MLKDEIDKKKISLRKNAQKKQHVSIWVHLSYTTQYGMTKLKKKSINKMGKKNDWRKLKQTS
jgi:hypothetical protein